MFARETNDNLVDEKPNIRQLKYKRKRPQTARPISSHPKLKNAALFGPMIAAFEEYANKDYDADQGDEDIKDSEDIKDNESDSDSDFENANIYDSLRIVSTQIKKLNVNDEEYDVKFGHRRSSEKLDEFNVFQTIIQQQTLHLTSMKRYAFALVSEKRNWILSAENENECREWLCLLVKLVQGKKVFSGYLVKRGAKIHSWKRRFIILFENRVLNYFHEFCFIFL